MKFHVDDADKEATFYVPFDSSQDTLFHLTENIAVACCVKKTAAASALSQVFKAFPALKEVCTF